MDSNSLLCQLNEIDFKSIISKYEGDFRGKLLLDMEFCLLFVNTSVLTTNAKDSRHKSEKHVFGMYFYFFEIVFLKHCESQFVTMLNLI